MKPRLTFEAHTEMGQALTSIQQDLQMRSVQLANAYPRSGQEGIPEKKLDQACKALSEARSVLKKLLFKEHPELAEVTVYYPGRQDHRA
ncbi:hypothetical protein [Streptomyces sp. NPDC047974]|uniref:hypothetical protein n=1 Tax=Streptomyces sp. NPDC047974 TaxID=3154343 RepID=UPI0034099318